MTQRHEELLVAARARADRYKRLWEQVGSITEERNARVAQLEAALREAIDFAHEGWGYASEYFHDKWDYAGRRSALVAVLSAAGTPDEPDYARLLLARLEYRYGKCLTCGWPAGGHKGPGRIKGNAENTHEEGCSMYAVLHGLPAPRLIRAAGSPSEPETAA